MLSINSDKIDLSKVTYNEIDLNQNRRKNSSPLELRFLGAGSAFTTGENKVDGTNENLENFLETLNKQTGLSQEEIQKNPLFSSILNLGKTVFSGEYQSNILLSKQIRGKTETLLLDCGGDFRHSFQEAIKYGGLDPKTQIDAIYISHPHADHIGGLRRKSII